MPETVRNDNYVRRMSVEIQNIWLFSLYFLRFVAKKVGLAGDSEEEYVYADMILEHVVDFMKGIRKLVLYP